MNSPPRQNRLNRQNPPAVIVETPFTVGWDAPDSRYLRPERPRPPALPLADVLTPTLARWVTAAAESKSAPADYVFGSLLTVAASSIGNARWASPWHGWQEPPVLWVACIGLPSSGKSPGIDAALDPLRDAEAVMRDAAQADREAWEADAEVARAAEAIWKDSIRAALKAGEECPPKPVHCDVGDEPPLPRLAVSDATIERLGVVLARQPKGMLLARDELAGWLESMTRYSGGSDRPFWLESYGGRRFTVERMGRDPVTIPRLSVWVLGGIQPDRLKSLLFKSDDDGLLARFLPLWPDPAPLRRPRSIPDAALMDRVVNRLLALEMPPDDNGNPRPWVVPFTDRARDLMDDFRQACRDWEESADGLLLSFIGKLPGTATRLALVLAYLDWASTPDAAHEPREIDADHFGRAAHLVESYLLPMARRAYADAGLPKPERAALRLVAVIRENGWRRFSSRDVLRLERTGLGTAVELNPALALLEDGEVIRAVEPEANPQGGRPPRQYLVNPAVFGGES